MKRLPDGSPKWLQTTVESLEDTAAGKVRSEPNKDFASGYFAAVHDLIDICEGVAAEEDAERRQKQLELLERERPNA